MRTPFSKIESVPFRGGIITVREKPLLPFGGYSAIQNMRGKHPGFIKRKGQAKLHDTADSTNKVVSLYQFNQTRIAESYFFAQMSDGDVLQATNDPPTVATSAVFGSEVYSGTATGMLPASWGNIGDKMLYSDGSDQHKIFVGTAAGYVTKFVKYDGAATPPNVPELGWDYSQEVSDGLTSTCAVLDSLNTFATHDCVFICTPVPITGLTWTISKPNGTTSTGSVYYRKSDGTWADCSITDGTADSGKTLATTGGAMTWTAPTDEISHYMYGISGFWYRFQVSAQIDSEVEITAVTYTASFQSIRNVWNGVLPDAVEAYVEGTTQYETYGAGAVDLDSLGSGKKIYIACADPAQGFYIDVGGYPNATGTAITSIKYWDGDSWVTVGTTSDGTSGLSNSGYITFPRQTAVQPVQFQSSRFYAYVYEVIFDSALSADMLVAISYIPYFDIIDFGNVGKCNGVWKDRAIYTFELWPEYLYVSEPGNPLFLNGDQYGILEAGDGRSHRITAMRKFHNELMVWQEEKGVEGGCLTMFEGYSPTTFGKILLSSRLGTFNNKSVEVVDGVLTSTATDEKIKTLAFFLSRYGVCVTDGASISIISDDIQNYFDPTNTTYCIRRGYENEHWLAYDSACNVIRIGLVTGSSATVPNTFLVFDLTDKVWSTDSLGQELACATEVEAGSGNVPVVQVGGGTDDGFVYQLNTGTNDVTTAITSYAQLEFSGQGEYLNLRELVLRTKADTATNNAELTVSANGIAKISDKNLDMDAEVSTEIVRRHRVPMNIMSQHISVKINHDTASKEMYLEDLGLSFAKWVGR